MALSINIRSMHSVLARLTIAVAVIAALLGFARGAIAQGTSGILPNPITTHELKGYADRLKLSDQQRQAAEAIHDQYKQDFRALRQGEIATFLKEMRSLQGNVMPKRDVMETFMKKMDLLNGRIATLDSRMFDQMQTILTDEQMAMMPRVRMARQRARYADNQMMWMTGNRAVDLSEVVAKLQLTDEQMQMNDPTLNQYEGRLTSSMTKLYDATTGMMMKMFDAMEEMGFAEQDMSDPENAQKFGEAMQQLWRDLTMQAVEAASSITELNQRTYKSISSTLPADKSRELRNSYYSQAFPESAFALSNETARFDEALKLEELKQEQRDALTVARNDLEKKMDRIVEETVRLIEQQRANFSPFDFNSETMEEYTRKLQEYGVKVTESRNAATELLKTTLGEDLMKKVEKAAMAQAAEGGGLGAMMRAAMEKAEASRAEATEADDASDASAYVDDAQAIQQAWTGDQFVAPPIGRSEINRYAAMLGISEEQKPLLTQIHATYLENFKKVQETEIRELTQALQSMWKFDIETQTTAAPTTDSVEATQKARRAAIDAVAKVDDSFFNDVQLALLDEGRAQALQRVRMIRQRDCWNRGTEGMWAFGSRVGENRIDLSSFLHKQPVVDVDRAVLDQDIWAYEQAATPGFGARFDASLAMQHAQDLWQVEMSQSRDDGENNQFKLATRYQEILGNASKNVSEAGNSIVKLNREWLAKIIAKLPSETAVKVQDAYNRAAFPNVYNDQLSLDHHLNEAAKLPDVGPEQQRRLNDLAAEYRPAYAHLCTQMTDVASELVAPTFVPGDDQESWKRWQERQESLANLRFDRDELCLRTMNHLKAILSEDQLRRIGGLPEPKKRQPFEDWSE
jgi:hypothetical protein